MFDFSDNSMFREKRQLFQDVDFGEAITSSVKVFVTHHFCTKMSSLQGYFLPEKPAQSGIWNAEQHLFHGNKQIAATKRHMYISNMNI